MLSTTPGLSTGAQIGVVIGCFLLTLSATIAAVIVLQSQSRTSVAYNAATAAAPATGRHRESGSGDYDTERLSRHSVDRLKPPKPCYGRNRPRSSSTPTVLKQATARNNDVTVSKITLADDVPVTVVYEDTGDKFTAV